jgi:hypothetical protein
MRLRLLAASFLAAAAALCVHGASAAPPPAHVVVYPRLGEPPSSLYTVRVRAPGGRWTPVDVYQAAIDEADPTTTAFALLSVDGPVQVQVSARGRRMHAVAVEPASAGIRAAIGRGGATATFALPGPANVSFEVDGDRRHNLQLFANPVDPGRPATGRGRRVVAFAAGVHDLPGDHVLRIGSGTTVYLAPGALVRGSLMVVRGAHDVVVRGPGVIDPSAYFDPSGPSAGVVVDHASRVGIRDVTILRGQNGGVTIAGSRDVIVSDVKEINADRYSDGVDIGSSTDVLIEGCFLRTSDDSIALWASNPFVSTGGTRDVTVRDSVLWPDVAHGLLVGPYGRPDGSDAIENLTVEDVDVLEQDVSQSLYQGAIGLEAGDSLTERHLVFGDVRIARVTRGKALDVRVYRNPNENKTAGRSIEDVLFRDVAVPAGAVSSIGGYAADQGVSGVRFEGLRRGGSVAAGAAAGGVEIEPFATGVVFAPRPAVSRWASGHSGLSYRGPWVRAGAARRATVRGATLTVRFTGTEAILRGPTAADGGLASVLVDGVARGRVDAYASHPASAVLFDTGALAPGAHTLVLRAQGGGNALSSGAAVAVASVQVVGGAER